MALVIKKYAEGDVIEKPTVEEAVNETLEPFQPVENPSVLAAMVPQLQYIIHRGSMEYDPATVRDYLTNDYNLRAWSHNRGLTNIEQLKFEQAVKDILVSGIDAGTLDFKDDNSIYVPEQYAGDGNYNTKDTLGGLKVITDDDKAARIEAVNYLKSAFAHGYVLPKVNKAAFNADRIIMQALAEKVGNGSMAALQSVWSGLSPLERQRVLRDTLGHLDYKKIFDNYDLSSTDVKNPQELHDRIQALLASFTGGDLTNENYQAAGRAGISILKDLIYGRLQSSATDTLRNPTTSTTEAEQALKAKEEVWRASGLYTEDQILEMIAAERKRQLEAAQYMYDLQVYGQEYQQLLNEILDLSNNSISIKSTPYKRYEPEADNSMRGLEKDLNDPNSSISKLLTKITGKQGLAYRNTLIENALKAGKSTNTNIRDLMYIMRSLHGTEGYVCFGYFPNLGKIVYGDLKTLTISTSVQDMLGDCRNPEDVETAERDYTSYKHPKLNYDNYKKYSTRTASTELNPEEYKEGGIIKAQSGAIINSPEEVLQGARDLKNLHYENRKLAAVESGVMSEKLFVANNKDVKLENFTWQDATRLATLATDVGALVASFDPGIGTAVSGGLSLLGTGADLVADVFDDKVSKGQVLTNLGINLGAAALGLLPGGKVSSIGAKLAKSAKLINRGLLAYGAIGMAGEVTNIISKGNKYGWDTLNTSDWVNIARATGMIAGIGAGAKRAQVHSKVRKNYSVEGPLLDLLVIEGKFINPKGKRVSTVELDKNLDKGIIDLLNAAPNEAARIKILRRHGLISKEGEARIKLLDNRSIWKKVRGKEVEGSQSWYTTTSTKQKRLMNWDEFLAGNSEEAVALRKALQEGTGNLVLLLVSPIGISGQVRGRNNTTVKLNNRILRYLQTLSIENPLSYVKAMKYINGLKATAYKNPKSKFSELSQVEGLFIDKVLTPGGLQRFLETSALMRPFVNESMNPVNGRNKFRRGLRMTWDQIRAPRGEASDYRYNQESARTAVEGTKQLTAGTPLALGTRTPKREPGTTVIPSGETIITPYNGGTKRIFTEETTKELTRMVSRIKTGKIKSISRDKFNKLVDLLVKVSKTRGKKVTREDAEKQVLNDLMYKHILNSTGENFTEVASLKSEKSNQYEKIISDFLQGKNHNKKYSNVSKLIDELAEHYDAIIKGTAYNGSLFKQGGQFARQIIQKYELGGTSPSSRTIKIGTQKATKDGQYRLYDYNEIFDDEALKALMTELANDQNNFSKYNTYNDEFFKLKKDLYGDNLFGEGSSFIKYNPASYDRQIFNNSEAGKLMNSKLTESRVSDIKEKYLDNWWGTKQNTRHYGADSDLSNLLGRIDAILKLWNDSGDSNQKAMAQKLAGLLVNPGGYGGLHYSTQAMRDSNNNQSNPNNNLQNQSSLDKFLAKGNDIERTPKDTYKSRIDWGNIGELYRLWLANRTNDKLRDSYKRDKVALESPAYKQGTIASTYAIENANEDASNRILAAMQNGPATSDAALNMAGQQNAYEQILKTEATNNATRDKYYQENVNANQEIANYNRAAGVTTANKNREAIVKWYNDYLDHMRDLDVEDFNNRDRWMASLIQQWVQKRALENNLNYLKYALNLDYNNVLYKLGLNSALEQTLKEREMAIRKDAAAKGITDEDTIQEMLYNDEYRLWALQQAKLAGITHDIESKVGMNDSMLYGISHSSPYWQTDVYNTRQRPPIATNPYIGINWNTGVNLPRVTYKRGGKVEYTEDKARKKLFDIMGQEYLDMLKRNSKYVLHKK